MTRIDGLGDNQPIDRTNRYDQRAQNIPIRYGSEAELRGLGGDFTLQVDRFCETLRFDQEKNDRIRSRVIGALLSMEERGILTPRVEISIERDRRKEDDLAVIIKNDSSSATSTPAHSPQRTDGFVLDPFDDESLRIDDGLFTRPPYPVPGEVVAQRADSAAEDEESIGVSSASGGGGAGLSDERGRDRGNQQGEEQEGEDSDLIDGLKQSADRLVKPFKTAAQWLFGR